MEGKYYLLTSSIDWADEHDVPALACFTEQEYKRWCNMVIFPHAHLGNSGDNFMEDEQGETGKGLIELGFVGKRIVDKNFYDIFNKANLSDLSLSNIFDFEQEEPDDWDLVDELEEDDDQV